MKKMLLVLATIFLATTVFGFDVGVYTQEQIDNVNVDDLNRSTLKCWWGVDSKGTVIDTNFFKSYECLMIWPIDSNTYSVTQHRATLSIETSKVLSCDWVFNPGGCYSMVKNFFIGQVNAHVATIKNALASHQTQNPNKAVSNIIEGMDLFS